MTDVTTSNLQQETITTATSEATIEAYRKLAEGVEAVMELEGPGSHVAMVLREAAIEIYGCGRHQNTPAFVGLHLRHFGNWKASHPNDM